ncbi:MAG: outer membrane lipoprotein carrier protein LolA [Planctomycetes bacterium]|nr:outer membrane lipoprotein carrier protein LolA [Planctomycetota bacterium]
MVLLSLLALGTGRAASGASAKEQAGSLPPSELLRRLRESRAPYHTFATRFVQRKHLAILDVELQSEGMIFFRRPGSVRYEIVAPVRSLMTYDGKKVQCYTFTEGAWKLLNNPAATAIGQVLRQIGRWIQGDFDRDRKMFDIDVVPADNYAGCIRLTPRSEALTKYIRRVEIYVEKAPEYRVTRVIIRESEVDLTDMRFRQELRNPSIPEGTFSAPEASNACVGIFPPVDRPDPNESPTRSGAAGRPPS